MMYLIIFVVETCIITYIYFKCDYLITNCSFRFGICFFSGFLQFCLKNIILLSKNYFKFVLNIVNLIKKPFFCSNNTNGIPIFFNISFFFRIHMDDLPSANRVFFNNFNALLFII